MPDHTIHLKFTLDELIDIIGDYGRRKGLLPNMTCQVKLTIPYGSGTVLYEATPKNSNLDKKKPVEKVNEASWNDFLKAWEK